ncbi:hypothetical protein OEW28_15270 [Defluviimonas sp. WL0002]|uniref:ATPase BadF/BadG/BcrA/BcrD type domain-containing protein n=1 Tax=Albidovulum marisflavi TaxID=2984159 RepID=A0ABT2ZFS7_9RHOB|nr:BadF/BadG/BcrA/BcrD ATPase family protein [Defluviimonas sp. WL0002]MCV2869990.1 hypothetical protein [Defluviimonas sp. WL0002]
MTMSPNLYIGIDGGGTSSRAVLVDGDRRIEVRGGPANAMRFDAAMRAVNALIADLAGRAGLDPGELVHALAHVGLAGVMTPEMSARVAAALPLRDAVVTDDQPTAIAGALGSRWGAVAAIGTGSFVGRQSGAGIRVLGGWGLPIGDQASGARLGRRLLEELMLAVDGLRPHSDLTRDLLSEHENSAANVVLFSTGASAADFATLAPRIVASALAGDTVGASLMREGADYIRACLTTLDHRHDEPLCLMGGLGPAYADWLGADLSARVKAPLGTSLDGALALARRRGEGGA